MSDMNLQCVQMFVESLKSNTNSYAVILSSASAKCLYG